RRAACAPPASAQTRALPDPFPSGIVPFPPRRWGHSRKPCERRARGNARAASCAVRKLNGDPPSYIARRGGSGHSARIREWTMALTPESLNAIAKRKARRAQQHVEAAEAKLKDANERLDRAIPSGDSREIRVAHAQ